MYGKHSNITVILDFIYGPILPHSPYTWLVSAQPRHFLQSFQCHSPFPPSAGWHSGSVRFLGVVLSLAPTRSCLGAAPGWYMSSASPLQLEQASAGMRQGWQPSGSGRGLKPTPPLSTPRYSSGHKWARVQTEVPAAPSPAARTNTHFPPEILKFNLPSSRLSFLFIFLVAGAAMINLDPCFHFSRL